MLESVLIGIICLLIGVLGMMLFMKKKDADRTKTDSKAKSKTTKKNEEKPKMEFSKKILYSMFCLTLIIVGCAIAMSYMTQTTDVYQYLIPSIFLELSVGTLFYYRKAEKENLLRESNRHEREMSEFNNLSDKDNEY